MDDGTFIDLLWIPVGAGTRFQKASLLLYESVAAAVARRPRATLVHAGLKLAVGGQHYVFELKPAPAGGNPGGEVTGPVGVGPAGRLRLFRYQACLTEAESLPDEQWAVAPAIRLSTDPATIAQVIERRFEIPPYVWGRRRPGHSEMWTSDSAVSWLLGRAGIDVGVIAVPPCTRAPGWYAGIEELRRAR